MADAGDGIQAYNYGIGDISVNVGFNVNIQALTSSTASSGNNAPYGIGAFNYGPGDIHVTTSTGDVINSGSSGINASNQSNFDRGQSRRDGYSFGPGIDLFQSDQ